MTSRKVINELFMSTKSKKRTYDELEMNSRDRT